MSNQIFIAHSKDDRELLIELRQVFSRSETKAYEASFEDQSKPVSKDLMDEINKSRAMFVVLGPNAQEEIHTMIWIGWEAGIATKLNIPVWILEDIESQATMPIPSFTDYLLWDSSDETQHRILRDVIESEIGGDEQTKSPIRSNLYKWSGHNHEESLRNKEIESGSKPILRPKEVQCPYSSCGESFTLWFEGPDEFNCPACRRVVSISRTKDRGRVSWAPSQTVRVVVPYGPGGGYDFYSRNLAATLQKHFLSVDVEVQNIEGGGGIVAMNQLNASDNPNHTLGILNTESHALAQIARPDFVKYDLHTLTYYPRVAGTTRVIAVYQDNVDLTTFEGLIETAVRGNIVWSNQGPQSTNAIQIKALAALGEIEIDGGAFTLENYEKSSVTFGGRGEELAAAQRGEIHATAGAYSSLFEHIESDYLHPVLAYSDGGNWATPMKNSDCATFGTTSLEISNTDEITAISGGPFHNVFIGPSEVSSEASKFWCDTIAKAIHHDSFTNRAEQANRPIRYANCDSAREGATTTLQVYDDHQDLLREFGLLS